MVGVETGVLKKSEVGSGILRLLEKGYNIIEVLTRNHPKIGEVFPKPEALAEDELVYRAYRAYRRNSNN